MFRVDKSIIFPSLRIAKRTVRTYIGRDNDQLTLKDVVESLKMLSSKLADLEKGYKIDWDYHERMCEERRLYKYDELKKIIMENQYDWNTIHTTLSANIVLINMTRDSSVFNIPLTPFINNYLKGMSGTQTRAEELFAKLKKEGHLCAVISDGYPAEVKWCESPICLKSKRMEIINEIFGGSNGNVLNGAVFDDEYYSVLEQGRNKLVEGLKERGHVCIDVGGNSGRVKWCGKRKCADISSWVD